MYLFKQLFFISIFFILFFTGCSSKREPLADLSTINKFYKNSSNGEIINTKSMHKYTLRPYSVYGIKYYPFVANIGDKFTGIASWYGPDFHSKKTSNGEIYNMYALTAAHKTLPMNTMLRVDNLENGRSVIVRINDRGPFVSGRIIDLSNKAAHAIDMVRKGTVQVRITVLGYNGEIENANAPMITPAPIVEPVVAKQENIGEKIEPLKPVQVEEKSIISSGEFSLQVGAFSKAEGAIKTRDSYQKKFKSNLVTTQKIFSNGRYLFKVYVNGFKTKNHAQIFKEQNSLVGAIIVNN